MEEKKLAKTEENSPSELIKLAITQGADLEKLQRLLDIRRQYEADEARKAYHRAMAEFKSNPPKIIKDRQVAFDKTKYAYASLANICEVIGQELSRYGLSHSWRTTQNGSISVTCRITHIQGHYEETTLQADADKTGSKNNIQALGSAVTYLERYTLLALTGLATVEQDDDGKATEEAYITEQQLSLLLDMLVDIGSDTPAKQKKFLEYMKISRLEELPAAKYQQAVEAIAQKKRQMKK